ncbi:hypothetical protein ACJJTC_004437 [Scirpophaga incertulas]
MEDENMLCRPYLRWEKGRKKITFTSTVAKTNAKLWEKDDLSDKLYTIKCRLRRTPGPNGQSPYELTFGRSVRTQFHAMLYRPTTSPPRRFPETLQIREFHPGERVQVRTYNHPHHRWEFAVVTHRIGRLHYRVTTDQGASWTRHLDQMLSAPGVPQQ